MKKWLNLGRCFFNFIPFKKMNKIAILNFSLKVKKDETKLKIPSKAQYFYSFKVSYDTSYEASQTFCFTIQCNQNITFEKPRTRRCNRLWMSRNNGLKTKLPLNKDLIVLGSKIQQVANMFTYKSSVYCLLNRDKNRRSWVSNL